MKCPCCSTEVETSIIFNNYLIATEKGVVQLTRTESRFFSFFYKYPNAVLTYRALVDEFYPTSSAGLKNIAALVYDLRRKLLPLGWTITNLRNRGYRLEKIKNAKTRSNSPQCPQTVHP